MKMKKKYWILFGIFVCSILFVLTIFSITKPSQDISYNGVSISEQSYKSIQETFPNKVTRVCDLEKGNCIVLVPIE